MKTEDLVLIGAVGVGGILLLSTLNKTIQNKSPTGSVASDFGYNLGESAGETVSGAVVGTVAGLTWSPFKWGERTGWDLSNWTKSWFGQPALPYPEDMR